MHIRRDHLERLLGEAIRRDYSEYGNTGCGVFKKGYKIRKIFGKKSISLKEIIVFCELK